MSRIGTLASNNVLINQLFETSRRLQNEQIQLSSEKVSQVYSGIAADSQRLVTHENSFASLGKFITNNDAIGTRLDIATSAVDAIHSAIRDFEGELNRFQASAVKDRAAADQLQSAAFRAMANVTTYLNTEADGRFIFAGGRVDRTPVELPYATLAAFQGAFDGARVTYPTTRDAHLENFSLAEDGNEVTNWLTFVRDNGGAPPRGRITATTAQFANVAVGSTITITGTGSNNGTYTVAAVGGGGTTVDIVTEMLTDEAAVPISVTYPDLNTPGATLTLTATATFNRAANTINHGGALNAIPVGSAFTVAGSASNNGTYTVASNTGGIITIESKRLTDEGTVAAPFFNSTSAAGAITFTDNAAPTQDVMSGPVGFFTNLTAGMRVVVSGTASGNNGTYTIASVATNGSSITIEDELPGASGADANAVTFLAQAAPGTIAATPYYRGDIINLSHRPSTTREFDWDLTAIDPAFEKALRAMGIIAQGAFGSEGGLDQNITRVAQAAYLVRSSLAVTVTGTPPFGTEEIGSIEAVEQRIGYKQVLLEETNDVHTAFRSYLETSMHKIEGIDRTEVMANILDDSRTLEASYQALARIRELTLVNFL
ncbi:MAG: hypothetical protein IT564_00625 [Rhodospirillales bacterium]|nr:hypothetical protein [Rhodospirillales bacterium]